MSFDKFRSINPKPTAFDVTDEKYVEKLCVLKPRKKINLLPILSTVAAAIAIVVGVSLWAIIGNGVRGQKPADSQTITTPADENEEATVTIIADSHIVDVPYHTITDNRAYFTFGGEDAEAIISIIESIESFSEPPCYCDSPYIVVIGDEKYSLSINETDAHFNHGGKKATLSYNDMQIINDILARKLTEEYQTVITTTEMILTNRDGFTFSRHRFKNKHSEKIYEFAANADYQKGVQPYDAEYKIGEDLLTLKYGLSLKGDKPFIVSSDGIYYLTADEAQMLKSVITAASVDEKAIEVKPPYDEPYTARMGVFYGTDKYFFTGDDSDALIVLLESYFYQELDTACDCTADVKLVPTHLRNEFPRGNEHTVAFFDDSTHITMGTAHVVTTKEDGDYIKQLLYKNCVTDPKPEAKPEPTVDVVDTITGTDAPIIK